MRNVYSHRCLCRAQGLRELHEQGTTREEIEGALRIMPFASFTRTQLVSSANLLSASRDGSRCQDAQGRSQSADNFPVSLQRQYGVYLHRIRSTCSQSSPVASPLADTSRKSKGLQDLFTEIVTNPAEWDPSGLLKLRRHVDPNGPQHNCPVGCDANICKGESPSTFLFSHVALRLSLHR